LFLADRQDIDHPSLFKEGLRVVKIPCSTVAIVQLGQKRKTQSKLQQIATNQYNVNMFRWVCYFNSFALGLSPDTSNTTWIK
jgi:hypothetical protein